MSDTAIDVSTPILVLRELVSNEPYMRKVLPFIDTSMFENRPQQFVFEIIHDFVTEYNVCPTPEALLIELNDKGLPEGEYELTRALLSDVSSKHIPQDAKWLENTTEEWCKDRLIYNALMESIEIAQGESQDKSPHAIPDIMMEALGFSFDADIGHSYFDNAEEQYEFYHSDEFRIPFDIDILNKITRGGVAKKTLNLMLAGINCFVGDQEVEVYLNVNDYRKLVEDDLVVSYKRKGWKVKVKARDLHKLQGLNAMVKTPSGILTPILEYAHKPNKPCVEIVLSDGTTFRCATTHRFQDVNGNAVFAKYAKEIMGVEGPVCVESITSIGNHDVYDVMIDAPHWYVSDGIIHHNTGKTTWLLHQAAHFLKMGKNALYITLEVAEEVIRERIDVNLFGETSDQIISLDKHRYMGRIDKIRNVTQGELFIKEYPSGAAHVGHFRHLINELKLKKGFIPDVICIDYLTEAASSRLPASLKSNTNTYFTEVAREFRALAKEFDVPIWSAIQGSRALQDENRTDAQMGDVADAIGIPKVSDFIFYAAQPEEMAGVNQAVGKVIKNRYANKNKIRRFLLGLDNDHQCFYNTEQERVENPIDAESTPVNNVSEKPKADSANIEEWNFG